MKSIFDTSNVTAKDTDHLESFLHEKRSKKDLRLFLNKMAKKFENDVDDMKGKEDNLNSKK